MLRRELAPVGQILQAHFLRAVLQQDAIELIVVVHVVRALLARDRVERRLRDIDEPLLHELVHLPVEERQQQRADVRAVHIGVRHDDDLVVAQPVQVERALPLAIADARADGRDHRPDFVVLKHPVQARLLHVDELAADRENGLELSVAALLGGAACRVALDDIQLRVHWVAVRAIGQFARQAPTRQRRLAHGLAGLAGRFTGARRVERLVQNAFRHGRIRIEVTHQPLVAHRTHDAVHLRRDQLHLRLRLELRIAVLDRDHRRQALAHIVARDLRVLVLQQVVRLRVLVDRPRHRAAEPRQVRPAVGIVNRVRVAEHLVVVAVVVLQHHVHMDLHLLVRRLHRRLLAEGNRLGMNRRLALIELLHELLDPVLVKKLLPLAARLALVEERDLQPAVQKRQLPQPLRDDLRLVFDRLTKNLRVWLERDERARPLRLPDHRELLHRVPALELHVMHIAIARDLDLEPLAHRVHALRTDAVGAAGKLVAALPVFAAGVQRRQHQLHARQAAVLVDVHRDAPPVVPDRDRAIHMDRHLDQGAMPRQMFVHRVVQHLGHAVMQRALVRAADIHAGLFTDGFEALELAEF